MGCLGSFGTNQYSSSQDNWFNYQGTYAATPQMINEANRRQKIREEQAAAENKKKIKDEIEDFLNKTVDPKLFVFDPNFFKDCDNIQKIKYDDSEYEGQMKDGKKHGKGITRFYSGAAYQGEYKEGKMHGKGIYKYRSGSIYNGEFKENKLEGKGIMRYTDGVYEGEWKNDNREGKGKFTWAEEDVRGNVY